MILLNMYMLFPIMIFFMACLIFINNRKHLLVTLLMLEYIMLILFILMMMYFYKNNIETYFLMIFLVFSVCEGALGLSILVSMIRTHGNNYFQSFNIMLC